MSSTEHDQPALAIQADTRRVDTDGKVRGALIRYRVLAWITGLWLLVLTAEMVYKYLVLALPDDAPGWFFYIAQAHGVFYILYLAMTLDLAIKARWNGTRTLLTALAGTIPFLSFSFEHLRTRDVRAEWSL